MFNLSLFRPLLPPQRFASLETALASLQSAQFPVVNEAPIGEMMDAQQFNQLQVDVIAALTVLYDEIDAVEVILRQAAARSESGLMTLSGQLDALYTQTDTLAYAMANRENPALQISLSETQREISPVFQGDADAATVTPYGVSTMRAGSILQSSFSGIPAANVFIDTYTPEGSTAVIPCRLGLPLTTTPYQQNLQTILNTDNTSYWSETVLSVLPIQAASALVPWLAGTSYITGAAVRLRFDFELPTRVSMLDLVPFSDYPLTILQVAADGIEVWKQGDRLLQQNGHQYLIFTNTGTQIVGRSFTITVAQEHATQILHAVSQRQAQDLRYWQQAQGAQDSLTQPYTNTTSPVQPTTTVPGATPNGDLLAGTGWADDNSALSTTGSALSDWNTWATNFPRNLAAQGIVLPAAQQQSIKEIGTKFGQIASLLTTLATPTDTSSVEVLRFQYIYGIRQANFVYEEYDTTGRFVSTPLKVAGELRQVKVVTDVEPATAVVTPSHTGEVKISASFSGFSNTLTLPTGAVMPTTLEVGMTGYLSQYPNTILTITALPSSAPTTITLDKSSTIAFPQVNVSNLGGTWYFSSPASLATAQKEVTFSLSLRDANDVRLPVYPDTWTTINPQTETPLYMLNAHALAVDTNGNIYAAITSALTGTHPDTLVYCTASGVQTTLTLPASIIVTTLAISTRNTLLLGGYTTAGVAVCLYECTVTVSSTGMVSNTWTTINLGASGLSYIVTSSGTTAAYIGMTYSSVGTTDYMLVPYTLSGSYYITELKRVTGGIFVVTMLQEFPFQITSVTRQDNTTTAAPSAPATYFVTNGTDTASYHFGVYQYTAAAGLSTNPVIFTTGLAEYAPFSQVANINRTPGDIPTISVLGVTNQGQVVEGVQQTILPDNAVLDMSLEVEAWDSNGIFSAMATTGPYLYVTDQSNNCIKQFLFDATEQKYLYRGWIGAGLTLSGTNNTGFHATGNGDTPCQGSNMGELYGPQGITTDASGNLYVADTGNYRIQKFSSTGAFQWWLGADGINGPCLHTTAPITNPSQVNLGVNSVVPDIPPTYYYTGTAHGSAPDWAADQMIPNEFYTLSYGYSPSRTGVVYYYGSTVRLVDASEVPTLPSGYPVTPPPPTFPCLELVGGSYESQEDYFIVANTDLVQQIGQPISLPAGSTIEVYLYCNYTKNASKSVSSTLGNVELIFGKSWDSGVILTAEQAIEPTSIPEAIANGDAGVWASLTFTLPTEIINYSFVGLRFTSLNIQGSTGGLRLAAATEAEVAGLSIPNNTGNSPYSDRGATICLGGIFRLGGDLGSLAEYTPISSSCYAGFAQPTGIAYASIPLSGANRYEFLYVTDAVNNALQLLELDSTITAPAQVLNTSNLLHNNSERFFGPSTASIIGGVTQHLLEPTSVIVNTAEQLVYVADTGNNRIVRFPFEPAYNDAGNPAAYTYVLGNNTTESSTYSIYSGSDVYAASTSNGGFTAPCGLASFVDSNGAQKLYTLDGTGRIQIFDSTVITAPDVFDRCYGTIGSDSLQFQSPTALVFTENALLAVLDNGNHRIEFITANTYYDWLLAQLAIGDGQVPLSFQTSPGTPTIAQCYLCRGNGYVTQFTYENTVLNPGWQKTECGSDGGGFTTLAVQQQQGAVSESLYAACEYGYLYQETGQGHWQWLRTAQVENRIQLLSVTDTFTQTSADGTVALSKWPFVDWEAIYTFHNAHYPIVSYNPNDSTQPVEPTFSVEIILTDGTRALADTSGQPFQMQGRAQWQTIPLSINTSTFTEPQRMNAIAPYIISPVTIVDESILQQYTHQLSGDGVTLPAGQQSALSFSQIVGNQVFRSQFKCWQPDPNYKIGIILTSPVDNQAHLYYAESATHQVTNLPQTDLIANEGIIVLKTALPQTSAIITIVENGITYNQSMSVDQIQLVVFDFFAPETVVPVYDTNGNITRDSNNNYVYTALDTHAVPYTADFGDYLRGLPPDLSKTPYNSSVPAGDASYNPVFMYVQQGQSLKFNTVLASSQVQAISVTYKTLDLNPRLIIDINRNTFDPTTPPLVTNCTLLIGRISP